MDRKTIGRYEILGELGRGAMGSVLRARDPAMGRDVAVKCILSAALAGEQMAEFRERFFREARAAGALSHPGIVPVFDVGEDDGVPFLVMELVQGRTLDAVLRQDQRYSLDRSCQIGQQIAEALGFAHRNGVIHRDIKPANILMTSPQVYDSERPRITDFGVAKLVGGEATTTGQLLGTPAFMPPEQFTGDPIDHRTDLFALGVILYRMMTGEQPFGGETLTAVSYKVVHTEPIPPSKLNPSIPPQLEAVILRCLAKNPAARYQTGEELAADLAALRSAALQPGAYNTVLRTGMQTTAVTDSGAGETINQVASLRPQASVARTYAMPMQPAGTSPAATGSATVLGQVSPNQAASSRVTSKPTASKLPKKSLLFVAAGVVVLVAAGVGAGFFLHKAPQQAAAPQPAPVTPPAASASAAPVAPVPVAAAPATPPPADTGSKAKASKAAAHKPAAGAKAAAPIAAPAVAVVTPPPAPAPAPAPARPAPAAAPAPAVVNFNPKTLDAATNTHLKLNLDGFSAPLTVTVQMDGKLYWSGTAGDKKGYQGLLVPPGSHQFRVIVKGQHAAKTSNVVSGDFAAKKHMTLTIKLRPEITDNSAVLDPSAQVSAALKKDLFPF